MRINVTGQRRCKKGNTDNAVFIRATKHCGDWSL